MAETISRELWSKLAERLKDQVQSHFTAEELEVIERFILIAGHGPTFQQVCESMPELTPDRHASPAYAVSQPSKPTKKSIA